MKCLEFADNKNLPEEESDIAVPNRQKGPKLKIQVFHKMIVISIK